MARMKHSDPKHSGFSHAGESYGPDKKGVIEIPDHAIETAFSHGFTLADEADADDKLEKPAAATTLKK